MKFSENWLREWVKPTLTTEQLAAQLTMAGLEVDGVEKTADDTLIEVDLTPNRGDCLSMVGMAREIAALNHLALIEKPIAPIAPKTDKKIPIAVKDPQACPRYVARLITGIKKTATTPAWLQARLQASDIRTIHPVVDILNYVMVELGQPMHAFDADKLQGPVMVRQSVVGEKVVLLDLQEVTLQPNTLVIADSQGVQAMAGIMGADHSAVSETTQNIVLESALFTAALIAGKARLYGLHTDSSFRFERGVSPDLQIKAIERATGLICEICGGEPGPVMETVFPEALPQPVQIQLRYTRLQKVLGISPDEKMVADILHQLGSVTLIANKIWQVVPWAYRYDLTQEVDLIEEIARIIGYDNIPNQMGHNQLQFVGQPEKVVSLSRVKRAFVDLGFQEAITYSFVDETWQKYLFPENYALALMNPISADMGVMRVSLWPGLLTALKFNQNRQQQDVKLFEVGMCFIQAPDGQLSQVNKIGGLICGNLIGQHWDTKAHPADFFDVKHIIESLWQMLGQREALLFKAAHHTACHPGQCAQILWQGRNAGVIGKLHPTVQMELGLEGTIYVFELNLALFTQTPLPVFQSPSRFPEIRRDISVVVDESLPSDSLINFVRGSAGEILQDVQIFDVYSGKGIASKRKSIALGLILQHPSRTLVDKEVDDIIHTVIAGLKKEFGADLRE